MPEHDMFDLDEAFATLERDVAIISSPRGAGQAVAVARRRRRTTYAAVAAVTVLAVGGAALGQGLSGRSSSVGPSEQPLPPPTKLTAEAFGAATAGWVDGWGTPNQTQSRALDSLTCLDPGGANSPLDASTRQGGAVYGAGSTGVTYVLALEFPPSKADPALTAISTAAAGCHPSATSLTTYADGSQVTYYRLPVTGGTGDVELWTGRFGDRIGLAVVGGVPDSPGTDVVARVDDLLIGALQLDSTLTDTSSLGVDSSSAVATPSGFGSVSEADFADALGSWPNGWQQQGSKSTSGSLPCAGDWTVGSSFGNGSSLGTNGDQEAYGFDSAENAQSSVQALVGDLKACAASPATITTVAPTGAVPVTVAVGSGGNAQVTWIVQRGTSVAYISIPGDTTPPEQVSATVGALISEALSRVGESRPPTVITSTVPQEQGGGTSSSSSSSAAAPGS